MKLLQHFARGGDRIVQATSDNFLLATYAAKRADGTLSLLVINKSRTETAPTTFALSGFSPAPWAPVYTYGIPQDEATRTGTGLKDVSHSSIGGLGPAFTASFPPYSVSVVRLYPTGTPASRIVNLSVRATAGAASQTLIVGFVIGGASGQLPVLVRALGPRLTALGVSGALPDPQLELHTRVNSVDTIIASNDNWAGDTASLEIFQRLGASPLTSGSLDAALSLTLDGKPYTAHVNAPTGGGVALAEVYNAATNTSAANLRLVNISGRAQVNTGDDVLIAGFVISGSGPKTVLIRGLGPVLSTFSVSGVLAAPRLELYQRINEQNTVLASNTGWGGSAELRALFTQLGASPLPNLASNDAVLLVTLQPGVYTAVVSGVGGATGVALVEVYEVD
jgi:hypothetical protein